MADEADQNHVTAATGGGVARAALSMALGGASRAQADAFLEKQSALSDEQIKLTAKQSLMTELQIKDLKREDSVRHWLLRVRHVSEVMKVTFEVSAALIALVLIAIISAAIWAAAHDGTVVVEAFKVPPDMAQRGLTGDVIASQVLDRLMDMQSHTESARAADTYASSFGSDIKVEIPDTGISIGEAYRYLAGWLGHRTYISGEIFRTSSGIALTARASNHPGARFGGSERDLDKLVTRAAEYIYGQTEPYRHAFFLEGQGRLIEADAALRDLALHGPASEKAWAYTLWMNIPLFHDNLAEGVSRAREGALLGPQNMAAQDNARIAEDYAEHEEQVLRYARATKSAFNGEGRGQVIAIAATVWTHAADAAIAEGLGDFAAALSQYDALLNQPNFQGSHWQSVYMKAVDAAKMHDIKASRRYLRSQTDAELFRLYSDPTAFFDIGLDFPQYHQYATLGDWRAARRDLEQVLATPEAHTIVQRILVRTKTWPRLALAEAMAGDVQSAFRLIARTPRDCDLCLRVRGQIDAAAGNFPGAAFWFSRAVASAPSIPFACTDWGEMLLEKGDYDSAIAKFKQANQKGPHFADPLEMWGEALMLKNRSDLALAKFQEANKHAPNWGRLHLKWGEALYYTGRKEEAKKQLSIAANLDLSASDKVVLASWLRSHG